MAQNGVNWTLEKPKTPDQKYMEFKNLHVNPVDLSIPIDPPVDLSGGLFIDNLSIVAAVESDGQIALPLIRPSSSKKKKKDATLRKTEHGEVYECKTIKKSAPIKKKKKKGIVLRKSLLTPMDIPYWLPSNSDAYDYTQSINPEPKSTSDLKANLTPIQTSFTIDEKYLNMVDAGASSKFVSSQLEISAKQLGMTLWENGLIEVERTYDMLTDQCRYVLKAVILKPGALK